MLTNADLCSRIAELQQAFSAGVIDLEIRKRSARVQVLQDQLNSMLDVQRARRVIYAADLNGGATGQLARDYRGKEGNVEVWKFDASLVAQITAVMKQATIEEGQWTEKREVIGDKGLAERLKAARKRISERQ